MNPFQKILQSKERLRLKLLNGKERKCNASEIQIKNSLFKKDDDNTTIQRVRKSTMRLDIAEQISTFENLTSEDRVGLMKLQRRISPQDFVKFLNIKDSCLEAKHLKS
jgi:hypothetical protein